MTIQDSLAIDQQTTETSKESMRLRLSHVAILATFTAFVYYTDAQALNDPITQYIEGRLGNRRIFWCPSGYGYLAYCPQPTDWDNYNWCCTWPYMGSWKPSCCPFAIPTGAVVTIIIASIVLVAAYRETAIIFATT
ncbi:hypothetical protein ANCCEY_03415 [Ancylostoma ceylanicum]|uniref:Uncharacterized protein n=1 Tax=Ancylostoma ceylanicum TaxID=53326 RepID=A0A0D6M537_9BILA|nr:hypothetical protein ANCCEY_03415 [Ancylostoma ceylanicum]